MKDTLQAGLTFEFKYRVPENKTVPYLYPESPEFQLMPKVLATGYMVGLLEWACLKAIIPHLEMCIRDSLYPLSRWVPERGTGLGFVGANPNEYFISIEDVYKRQA